MKKNLLILLSAVLAAGAWAVDLKGSWKLNPWSGYKPKPDFVQKKDGFVSVTNITGKSGKIKNNQLYNKNFLFHKIPKLSSLSP